MRFCYGKSKKELVRNMNNPRGLFSWNRSRDPGTGEEYDEPPMIENIVSCKDFLEMRTQSDFKDIIDRNAISIYHNIKKHDKYMKELEFENHENQESMERNLSKIINACQDRYRLKYNKIRLKKDKDKDIVEEELYHIIKKRIYEYYPNEPANIKRTIFDSVIDALSLIKDSFGGEYDLIRADILKGENPTKSIVDHYPRFFYRSPKWPMNYGWIIDCYPEKIRKEVKISVDAEISDQLTNFLEIPDYEYEDYRDEYEDEDEDEDEDSDDDGFY